MKKSLLPFIALFFYCCCLQAQQSVLGQVLDAENSSAAFASLRLFQAEDSIFVAGVSADDSGVFTFENVSQGRYYVRAALIGYADLTSDTFTVLGESLRLPPLVLTNAAVLGEVQIVSKKPLIEIRPDRVVVNVENSALVAGNSALELLRKSPGVVVTPQDNLLLQGQPKVLVTLNGRPLQMSGTDLANYLRSLPADRIAQIELISNPPSQYDAQGIAGIINIRLKKDKNPGWKGALNLGNAQALHHRARGGLQLDYNPGNLSLYGNLNHTDAAQSIRQDLNRSSQSGDLKQRMTKTEQWMSTQAQFGADYTIGKGHSIGAAFQGSVYDNDMRGYYSTEIGKGNFEQPDSILLGNFSNPEKVLRQNYNLNYRFADTSGTVLSFDADYIHFKLEGGNHIGNQVFDIRQEFLNRYAYASEQRDQVDIWSLKSDFSKILPYGFKLGAGAKVNRSSTQNAVLSSKDNGAGPVSDPGRSNQSAFEEQIAATYLNLSSEQKRFAWQLGLRGEHTRLEGNTLVTENILLPIRVNRYTDLFPTAFVQYKMGPQAGNSLSLSYGKRIDRPAYRDLNPFVWQTDAYTAERGNPNLKPAYIHSMTLKFTYKYAASLSLGYARTTDLGSNLSRIEGEQVYSMPENLGRQDNYSLNLNAPIRIADWWNGYGWVGIWESRFSASLPEGIIRERAFGGGAYLGQQISLPLKIQLDCSFWAQFPTSSGFARNKGIWSVDLGLKRMFLGDKLQVLVGVNDLFNTQHWRETQDLAGLKSTQRNDWESHSLNVQLTWNFGNQKLQGRNRKSSSENENKRIKGGK